MRGLRTIHAPGPISFADRRGPSMLAGGTFVLHSPHEVRVCDKVKFPHNSRSETHQAFGGPLRNGANKSIGTGRKVVVLCSLEISRMVCRKRSCSAIGWVEIIAAA